MFTQKQRMKGRGIPKSHFSLTRKTQSGGYILQSENDFFDWILKDENIEKLLKSTLRLMDHKKETAKKLLAGEKAQLKEFYAANVQITAKGIQETKPLATMVKGRGGYDKELEQFMEQISTNIRSHKAQYLSTTIETILSTIASIETLEATYNRRRDEICSSIFAKRGNPEEYKEALAIKRASILKGVNTFLEEFTGESNRRHRLFILNYALDFAENWTSFQDNYRLNIILTGGAGLGKTTFAKAIGPLFYEFGLLAKSAVNVREKRDFIAEYIGQTQTRTYSTLYSGIESVIFIDEAYSVSGCGKTGGHDYGQEFIDALVDVTQKSRGLFSIIAAGYKSEMHHCFLDKNPGMRRRFPNELELKPYTVLDLDNILIGGILKKFFPMELKSVFQLDLLKERSIYTPGSNKFKQFYDELQKRSVMSGTPALELKDAGDDAEREAQIERVKSSMNRSQMIQRYRTKILGLYRFFLMLTTFDTNFSSFQELFSVHLSMWSMIVEDPTKIYKYNMYRLLAILYMSQHQQKREILKSYILRVLFSEKEGSLFPNQAGDMGTLSTFILSEPNVNENITTQLQNAVNIFNNYFVTRGGSKLMLDVEIKDGKSNLYIYYVGGGFISHRDFEKTVLERMFRNLTDEGDIGQLWTLGSLTPEKRNKIIQNINLLYTQAVLTLSRDAEQSLKEFDASAQAEKRLPSGIDARFLDAEMRSYKSMLENSPEKFGKEEQKKTLSYVNTDDYDEDDSKNKSTLDTFISEGEGSGIKVKEELDINLLCPNLPKPPTQADLAAAEATRQRLEAERVAAEREAAIQRERNRERPNRTFYPGMNEENEVTPGAAETTTRSLGYGIAGPPPSRSMTSYGLPPQGKQPPNYLFYRSSKQVLLDDWFDMVGKSLYRTPIDKKASYEIAFYINRDKFPKGGLVGQTLNALVPMDPGYHLFGIREKATGPGALRGLLAPHYIYKLSQSKQSDTPTTYIQTGGPPETTPWKLVFLGKRDAYLIPSADYYNYGIHIVNKYPDKLYFLEKSDPAGASKTSLINFKSLETKLLRDRPILGRKARYVVRELVERPANLAYPSNFPPNTVFYKVSSIVNLRTQIIYGLLVNEGASKIENMPPPQEATPFTFVQAELTAVPPPSLTRSSANARPISPVPPPALFALSPPPPLNTTRRNKPKNKGTGTLNANTPAFALNEPPGTPREAPETLYYLGGKKPVVMGFAQEPITLLGEFLEVAPQVRDRRYKISKGLRKSTENWKVMVEDTQGGFSSVTGLAQYKLKTPPGMTPETMPPASGSKPWVFELVTLGNA